MYIYICLYIVHLDILFVDAHAYLVWLFLHSGICLFLVLLCTIDMSLLQDIYTLCIFPLYGMHAF